MPLRDHIAFKNLEGMNANKVFNYLIQAHETELNIKTIIELQRYLLIASILNRKKT